MGAKGGAAACSWELISSEQKASQSKGKCIENKPKESEETGSVRSQEGHPQMQRDTAGLPWLARL